jgi:hypothetical protein
MIKDGGPSHQHVGSSPAPIAADTCSPKQAISRENRGSQLYFAVSQFFCAHQSVGSMQLLVNKSKPMATTCLLPSERKSLSGSASGDPVLELYRTG